MIVDRTEQDVITAKNIRDTKIKQFIALTEEEKEQIERGFLTIDGINRIEKEQKELAKKLNQAKYLVDVTTKEWEQNDFFGEDDLIQWINNNENLKHSFFKLKNTPQKPNAIYHYDTLNAIEKIIYDLTSIVKHIEDTYAYTGDVECGE